MKSLFYFLLCLSSISCGNLSSDQLTEKASPKDTVASVPDESAFKSKTSHPLKFIQLKFDANNQMPTDMVFVPEQEEVLITFHSGEIGHFSIEGEAVNRLKTFMVPHVFEEGECGLNSITFDTENNVYIGYCSDKHTRNVSRFSWSSGLQDKSALELTPIFSDYEDEPNGSIHTIGDLIFDKDQYLYIFLGDMGFHDIASNDFRPGAKDVSANNNKGKILRIDPSHANSNGKYEVVSSNPFAGDLTKNQNIYAYGLRNPWKGFIDSSNRLWLGDVGGGKYEEINIATTGGEFFGYQEWEGPCQNNCEGLTQPTLHYLHDFNHRYRFEDPMTNPRPGWAIWIGIQYMPNKIDRYNGILNDYVLYGDLFKGWVRAAKVDDQMNLVDDIAVGNLENFSPVSWNQGQNDFIYLVTMDGNFLRVEIN